MELESSLSDRKWVEKGWGSEEWIVNADGYCGKILHLNPGWQCSLHYHNIKDETFMCVEGLVMVEFWPLGPGAIGGNNTCNITMLRGWARDALRVPVGTPHRFMAVDFPARLIEFSTRHDDMDVVRVQKSRKAPISKE